MRLKQEIGSEAVRDIILEARARVAELPPEDLRDPWPSYRNLDVEAMPVNVEPTRQDK
jgi:hypothetical protein